MSKHRHGINVTGWRFTPDESGTTRGESVVYRACRTCGARDTLTVEGMWAAGGEGSPWRGVVEAPPAGPERRAAQCGHCEGATYVPETCSSCHQLVCGACWDEAVGPVPGPGERVVIWLRALLAASPLAASNVKAAAKRAGLAWRTVVRAKEVAGVESVKRPYGWIWRLPASNQNSEPKSPDLAFLTLDAANGEKGSWCKGLQRIWDRLEDTAK